MTEFGKPTTITDIGNGRVWTDDVGEISGFGGGYEDHCRKMLRGALVWLDEHPTSNPEFSGFQGIYGVIKENNDDAKALTQAIAVAGDNDFTGAMHHAVVNIAMYVKANGWDKFVAERRKTKQEHIS